MDAEPNSDALTPLPSSFIGGFLPWVTFAQFGESGIGAPQKKENTRHDAHLGMSSRAFLLLFPAEGIWSGRPASWSPVRVFSLK
eukprot:11844980-Prorocentrum_lima.AAC.1